MTDGMTDLDAMLRSLDVSVRRDLYAVVTAEVGSSAAADRAVRVLRAMRDRVD